MVNAKVKIERKKVRVGARVLKLKRAVGAEFGVSGSWIESN